MATRKKTTKKTVKKAPAKKKAKKKVGRPTVWTKTVLDRLFDALELGMSRAKSACYAGVSARTFWDRLAADEAFKAEVEKREAEGIHYHISMLRSDERRREMPDSSGHSAQVSASKFFLATHDRDAFTERKEVKQEVTGAVKVDGLDQMTSAQRKKLDRVLAQLTEDDDD